MIVATRCPLAGQGGLGRNIRHRASSVGGVTRRLRVVPDLREVLSRRAFEKFLPLAPISAYPLLARGTRVAQRHGKPNHLIPSEKLK